MAVSKRRKARKKRSFITTTYHVPKWQKDLQAAWKGFKREAWNIFAVVGFITMLVLAFRFFWGGG